MNRIPLFLGGLFAAAIGFSQSENPLTLEQALALARTNSPALRAAQLNVDSARAAVDASGLWSNPSLSVEAEGLGSDAGLTDRAEYSVGIKQEFQRGGKRSSERIAAGQAVTGSEAAAAESLLMLETDVRRAFAELLAQQEIGRVRSEQLELAKALVEVAARRLDVGAGSELEQIQAELTLEETTLDQTCCFGDLAAARAELASLLGLPEEQLPQLTGAYYDVEPLEQLIVSGGHPALRRIAAAEARLRAEARRARAEDVGNVTLGAGYKYEADGDVDSFVVSASMPLSFNRRGRTESSALLIRAEAVRAQRDEVRRQLQQQLDSGRERQKGAVMETTLIRDNLLPRAEQAYAISREGYEAGRFSWLELISAQQHLADLRIRYIESLLAVHRLDAELMKFREETR